MRNSLQEPCLHLEIQADPGHYCYTLLSLEAPGLTLDKSIGLEVN